MKYPNFVGSAYTSQAKNAAADRAVNLYVEGIESGTGKDGARTYLVGTPGYKTFVSLPDAPIRGLYSNDGTRVFAVAGKTLFEITSRRPPVSRMSSAELRFAILQAAGGNAAVTHTKAAWEAYYVTVTAENLPLDAYVFTSGTLDEWFPVFMAEAGYVVIGTLRGSDGTSTGRAQMFANGNQLFVVAGQQGYISGGTGLVPATAAVQGAFVDGYYIALNPDLTQFHISDLYDGTKWGGLEFARAEGSPDASVGILADHRELWVFGQQSIEVFANDGNPKFPFERVGGGFIEQGCAAGATPAKLDNTVFWLGSDERGGRIVWRATGYSPSRVSNHAMEQEIAKYPRVDDAEAFGYEDGGHAFYEIHFPSANPSPASGDPSRIEPAGATWVYDCTASAQLGSPQWHERAHWDAAHGMWLMHRGRCHAYARGKHLIGDWTTGQVYEMNASYRSDNGEPLRWLRSAPHLSSAMQWLFFHELLIDMQVGYGPDGIEPEAILDESGNRRAPLVCLRISNDGGNTWGNERWTSAGKLGKYQTRVRFRRLGKSYDRAFELSGSDPAFVAITNADLNPGPGSGS